MKYALFFYRANGEPERTDVRMLRVHVARTEAQVTTVRRGWSPGRPEIAYFADGHNFAYTAVVSIPISQAIKEYSISCFPSICVEIPAFGPCTTNIELATICCISTSRCKSCKCRSFWLNIPRWGRGVDCFCYCCICYARIACEILVPKLVAMAATPVIIIYIIEREWVLNSCACSLITTNSQPRILVIIIGLKIWGL